MRIAFDARTAQGPRRGMGSYAHSLLNEFAHGGNAGDITLLTDRRLPPLPPELSSAFKSAQVGGPGGSVAWEQWYLPLALRHFDLFHAPANAAPVFSPHPVVITLHDAIFVRKLGDISAHTYPRQVAGHFYRRYALAAAARRAALVLTVSEASAEDISAKLGVPRERIVVSGEALPESFKAANPASEDGLRKRFSVTGPFLLALGAYEKRKNIPLLFRVLEKLPGYSLVLAGADNRSASGYEAEVRRRKINERVRFLPFVSLSDLKGLYSTAAAFLFPSRKEGFGLPILEAMHCGTPAIASDIPSSRETAGDAAVLLDPDDENAWAAAVSRLGSDTGWRAELAGRGKEREASFTWVKTARATLDAYRRVLEGGN